DLSTSTLEPRGMDGGKSAVRWYAEIAVHAYGSVAAHSPERNFGTAQRSRSQSTRPLDCEREHLLTQGDLERQCRVRVRIGIARFEHNGSALLQSADMRSEYAKLRVGPQQDICAS